MLLRFKQILTNLISNAIKFTPDGEIIVRVRMEHDDIGQCLLHFSVQDSGIGLSGTDRKNYLSRFARRCICYPPIWWYRLRSGNF